MHHKQDLLRILGIRKRCTEIPHQERHLVADGASQVEEGREDHLHNHLDNHDNLLHEAHMDQTETPTLGTHRTTTVFDAIRPQRSHRSKGATTTRKQGINQAILMEQMSALGTGGHLSEITLE